MDPSGSLLGRFLRRTTRDHRRAESLRVAILGTVPVLLLLAGHLAGQLPFVPDARLDNISIDLVLEVLSSVSALLLLLSGTVGWRRSGVVRIDCEQGILTLELGSQPIETYHISDVSRTTATEYHQHYSRYNAVRRIGSISGTDTLLAVWTSDGLIVVAAADKTVAAVRDRFGRPHESEARAA